MRKSHVPSDSIKGLGGRIHQIARLSAVIIDYTEEVDEMSGTCVDHANV